MQRRAQVVGLYKPGLSFAQIVSRDAQRSREASKSLRAASYARARLVATPRGVPMYAVGGGQMSRGEVKCFDVAVLQPVTTDPYGLRSVGAVTAAEPATAFVGMTELNCVAQGSTSYNRIGTKILIKNIQFRCTTQQIGSGPTQSCARFMLVYDHQPNGAFPGLTEILADNISGNTLFTSGVNMSNRSRFIVLRDKIVNYEVNGDSGAVIDWFVKTKLETQFKSSTNTIGDITSGALYFIAFANSSSAVMMIMPQQIHCRIRYFD